MHGRTSFALAAGLTALAVSGGTVARAQQGGTTLTIPYLANASTPDQLDFSAAICDVSADGTAMQCRFRQVFILPTSLDPTHCAITTNGYEESFALEAPGRWTTAGKAIEGDCGFVERTTLEDGGATRWTMTVSTKATKNVERADCRAGETREVFDYKSLRRQVPCKTIQPGAIER